MEAGIGSIHSNSFFAAFGISKINRSGSETIATFRLLSLNITCAFFEPPGRQGENLKKKAFLGALRAFAVKTKDFCASF